MNVGVVIVCAGVGSRLGGGDKALLDLGGKPLFYRTYQAFKSVKKVNPIVLVLRKKNFSLARKLIKDKRLVLVEGGKKRKDSVYNGLRVLAKNIDYVLVHDGARPFVSGKLVLRVISALSKNKAVICAVACKDAVKKVKNSRVQGTLVRQELVSVQTPQGFNKDLLLKAYAGLGKKQVVDDAQAVEFLGEKVKVVKGEVNNIKITYPEDICYAQMLNGDLGYRVGLAIDIHRFSKRKKKLILAGASIPADVGLEAVSDGDVVLHAVADGICGACSLGDIGDYFPPAAKKSKGINSRKIVDVVLRDIKEKFTLENIDITVITERPKLAPHKRRMLDSLKKIFPQAAVNVKIKSKEGLDILGGKESMACMANVLVKRC